MNKTTAIVGLAAALVVAGCGSGSNDAANTVIVNGDVSLAYAKRVNTIGLNPTDGTPSAPGGDLIVREKSSPSAREFNVTAGITQGLGDVSDPEVSYDGKKVVFAMTCPSTNSATINGVAACTGRWNIWEYDTTSGGLAGGSLRRITSSADDDDVDPAYLPAAQGFVFSSNRQSLSRTVSNVDGTITYAVDEYERERVLNLHTMDAQGGAIMQISVNQSHDRNPVVRPNGDIMFSRWEHVGPRNRFAIFRTKPDGTDMFVLYGSHSPGNSFLNPRDMDPKGAYAGQVVSSLMSLSGTREGGALMMIDAANYSEQNTPANNSTPVTGGQVQATEKPLNMDRGLSLFGRVTTPFPLWDGTDRVLVSYRACEVTKNGNVVPCATLTQAEITRLAATERPIAEVQADTVQDNVPPSYAVYMFDPKAQTWLIVAAPPAGYMYTDPVPLQARAEPNPTQPTVIDPALAAQGLALIEVRSVYDTDGLQRMGETVLAAVDLPAGCARGIAQTTPIDPADTRASVADLLKMKDPADPAYLCAPARFVRATRAVAPVAGMTGMRQAIGETEFEAQQILGYAAVEPDGSFKLLVPADTPLALSVLDSKGRSLQTHLNWIQVRPGERRTCDGCHSPRRGAALNAGSIVDSMASGIKAALSSQHQAGETMAALRMRIDAALNVPPAARSWVLQADPAYTDIWADTAQSGVQARAPIALRYTGNDVAADDLATLAPSGGIINYPDNIAPIWTRVRSANGVAGAGTCTNSNCHAGAGTLDLRATFGGSGRMVSYEELLIGDPRIGANGQPVTRLENGVPVIVRLPALVENMAGNADGIARASRLTEIMFGEQLKAGTEARAVHPNPPPSAPNHASLLNAAEKRLISEWMDLGAQYLNDPSQSASVRSVAALSRSTFEASVLPVLQGSCVACHQPVGDAGAAQPTTSFVRNRFVLTGNPAGDYNVTLTMVTDTCNAAANALLMRPSTIPHPAGAIGQTTPVLAPASAGYAAIASWISSGCTP